MITKATQKIITRATQKIITMQQETKQRIMVKLVRMHLVQEIHQQMRLVQAARLRLVIQLRQQYGTQQQVFQWQVPQVLYL